MSSSVDLSFVGVHRQGIRSTGTYVSAGVMRGRGGGRGRDGGGGNANDAVEMLVGGVGAGAGVSVGVESGDCNEMEEEIFFEKHTDNRGKEEGTSVEGKEGEMEVDLDGWEAN